MKDIQEFLSLLDKVKKTGNSQWMACCPAHGDDTPSLAISEDNRKILVHCHAGCTPENIASAVGLRVNDLFLDDVSTEDVETQLNTPLVAVNNNGEQLVNAIICDGCDEE